MYSMELFNISGYWKDDNTSFDDYIVCSYHSFSKKYKRSRYDLTEDDIFYYGLSEEDIKEAIENPFENILDFVITSYTKLKTKKT